jgi:adenylate kinase family enzyme
LQRVAVIGAGGAGKSTFSRRLAAATGLPLVHLDAEHWGPGWVEPAQQEWRARMQQLVAGERWILDGNFGGTLELRLAACDTVVFLDIPAWRCLWRVLKRRIANHGRTRAGMAAGCIEKLDAGFAWWIVTYGRRRRPAVLARLAALREGQRAVVGRRAQDVVGIHAAQRS